MNKKPKITYSAELLALIEINCPDCIQIIKSNFTAKGVEAKFRDKFNGQLYRITIEALPEEYDIIVPPRSFFKHSKALSTRAIAKYKGTELV